MVLLLSSSSHISCTRKKLCNLFENLRACKRTSSSANSQLGVADTWEERLKSALKRYEDFFGITKLTEMHDNVLQAQSRVHDVQQKRRKVQEDILTVQVNLQEIQNKLEKVSRGDDMFLSIVTQEHEFIKQQKHLQSVLAVCDQTEREEQTALALAINNSQDHERTYREKNKYISLIAGVVGGCVGVIGSSINNWRHRKDIKIFAQDIKNVIKEENSLHAEKLVKSYGGEFQKVSILTEHLNEMLPESGSRTILHKVQKQTGDMIQLVNAQEEAISNIVNYVNTYINGDINNTESFHSEIFIRKILHQVDDKVEQRLKSHSYATAYFISTSILVTVIICYILNKH